VNCQEVKGRFYNVFYPGGQGESFGIFGKRGGQEAGWLSRILDLLIEFCLDIKHTLQLWITLSIFKEHPDLATRIVRSDQERFEKLIFLFKFLFRRVVKWRASNWES